MVTSGSPAYESPSEAASRLGWPLARVRKLIRGQQVRHVKLGGIYLLPHGALEEYLEANTVEPIRSERRAD
jgi:excisionase family DNA binding protein